MQQTQVSRGTEYYERFIAKFPDIFALAKATWRNVLPVWRGLGYYRRGQNMLKTAKVLVADYGGEFPSDRDELLRLPGVGPYTAAALQSFAFRKPVPALDTNLFRVLSRYYGVTKERVPELAEELYLAHPRSSAKLNHGLMDIGALICKSKKVLCEECPLSSHCHFRMIGAPLTTPSRSTRKKVECDIELAVGCLIHHDQYFLSSKKGRYSSFPAYPCATKSQTRQVLKESLKVDYKIEVAVRPPFVSIEGEYRGRSYRLHYCRCRVLKGDLNRSALRSIKRDRVKTSSWSEIDREILAQL